jgi:hypothetical protein
MDLAACVSHKMQVLEDEIVFLKRVVASVPRGDSSSKTKTARAKVIWWCEKFQGIEKLSSGHGIML